MVGDLEGVEDGGYISLEYNYEYLSSGTSFAKVSNTGYEMGTPLVLLKSAVISGSTVYYRMENPLNLAFRQADGFSCRTSTTDTADSSFVKLTFGNNQVYSCYGDSSEMYSNLRASFDYVAKMGAASETMGDFTPISWPTIDATQSLKLNIYYLKVGAAESPQFYVTNMTV